MHRSPPMRRRIPRLAAVVMLLGGLVGSLATVATAPPAGAVPVDGRYSGSITNVTTPSGPSTGTSAPMSVVLSTPAFTNRDAVTAAVTIEMGTTVSVDCAGVQSIPVGTINLSGTGGTPSAAAPGTASLNLSGTAMAAIPIPVTITGATVAADRSSISGSATLDLPGGFPLFCTDAVLNFSGVSNAPYAIRTGHDGTTDPATGFDLTHMIDKEPVGMPGPWERCMYLWATLPPGEPIPASATWAVESGAPAGAHILAGWSGGSPGDETGPASPLRTKVCITDATPVDTTFTVNITTPTRGIAGRVLLWVGNFVNYPGRAQGDVHNVTFDETRYDFQGVGEYVDAVANGGKDFAVQSRLETVPSAPVSVTTAIAARVDGDRVGVYLDAAGQVEWYLDGKPVSVPAKLPSGGMITNPTPDHWRVTWPHNSSGPGSTAGTSMQVSLARWTPKDHLNIDELLLGPGLQYGQVHGLLGSADRDPANDLTPSYGGNPVSPDIDPSQPAYEQPLYKEFGRSWLVTTSGGPQDTLFDYLDPKHPDPASYENETFPAERPGVVEPRARAVCKKAGVTAWPQIDFCTYDVEVTGAREIAEYYRDGWLPV